MPAPTAIFTRAISATRTTTTITKAISTAAPATTKKIKTFIHGYGREKTQLVDYNIIKIMW